MRTWNHVEDKLWVMEETPFSVRYNPERDKFVCFEIYRDDEVVSVAASLDGAKLEARRLYQETAGQSS